MVCVAIAGGTGHVGRTLIDELVESKKHEVFVLARKVSGILLLRATWNSSDISHIAYDSV